MTEKGSAFLAMNTHPYSCDKSNSDACGEEGLGCITPNGKKEKNFIVRRHTYEGNY